MTRLLSHAGLRVAALALLGAGGALLSPAPGSGVARAQTPPPAPAPPPASAAPMAPIATSAWGGRQGAAEVGIVGGNVASARERALTEAMKQAVDQALSTAFPEARTQQPKVVAQVLGRARTYVRRYRTLEEGERGRNLYAIKIEADVDEAALARVFDKPGAGVAAAGGAAASGAPAYLLVAAGVPDAATAVTRGFSAAGARVQQSPAELADPPKAVEAAARAGVGLVAFVNGTATAEGKVRGPGVDAVACSLSVRVLAAGSGLAVAEESESARGFAENPDRARSECFQRAAVAAVPRIVPIAGARGAADVRTVVIDADVVEAGAVPALVRHLRGLGSVSAVEVRRISAGHAELWARSRTPAPSLAAALGRDTGGPLALSAVETSGDILKLRARLRELPVPAPPAPAAVAPPAPPSAAPAGASPAKGATQ